MRTLRERRICGGITLSILALAVGLFAGCGGSDAETRIEPDRTGPAFEDLSVSTQPFTLEPGEMRLEVRGDVSKTLECDEAKLSDNPRPLRGAPRSPDAYFTSFWVLEDCNRANLRLHVLKSSLESDVELRRGRYPDGKPDVEFARENQNFSEISILVSSERDFFLEKGEIEVTNVSDEEVSATLRAVLAETEVDRNPRPGVGVEGALRIPRGDGEPR